MARILKITGIALAAAVVIGAVLAVIYWDRINEIRGAMAYAALFEPEHIDENFRSFPEMYPHRTVERAGPVFALDPAPQPLPETYTYNGQTKDLAAFIERTDTTGLVILKDGKLVHEQYGHGNEVSTAPVLMSVSKSVVSALFGIAMEKGFIDSLNETVDSYATSLKDSGYAGVRIKDVMQMSSGIRFTEHYGDLDSDIVRLAGSFGYGSVNEFVATLENEREPGTFNHYVSADTQVLAMVLEAATGETLADLTQDWLWSRLGAEYDAYWVTDPQGDELALGGFNATARDMARFGQLYLDMGKNFEGAQVVPADWVRASVTPDASHLMPGRDNTMSDFPMGYGYQWWIPEFSTGDYSAIGIYGQFVYVNPEHRVVIAKTSTYRDYLVPGDEMEPETIEAFRAIAAAL